jgi:hypothetical protein
MSLAGDKKELQIQSVFQHTTRHFARYPTLSYTYQSPFLSYSNSQRKAAASLDDIRYYLEGNESLLGLFGGKEIHMGETLGRKKGKEVEHSMSKWHTKRSMSYHSKNR